MLLSFHNDAKIKAKYLARVRVHKKADEIIKGTYWEDGKGCAVGCTVHSSDHSDYERELGIPEVLAHLEDCIFENLSNGDAKLWPERFLSSVPVGKNLSAVWPTFAVWLLTDNKYGVIQYANVATKICIKNIVAAYESIITGKKISEEYWKKLAADAAYAAAYAADAAYAAAYAAYAADAASTREKLIKVQANKLIEILESI